MTVFHWRRQVYRNSTYRLVDGQLYRQTEWQWASLSLLSSLTSVWKTLRRGSLHKPPTNRCDVSDILMKLLSSGCSNQRSWRGILTIWMAFTGVHNPPWRWRKTAISVFLALTYAGDLIAPWTIRSAENLPTQTPTWALDHITILPTYKLFCQPWCTEPRLCVTTSMMSWSYGKIGIVSDRYDGPLFWPLEPTSHKGSPPRSLFFCMSGRHMVDPAEWWLNTTLNELACHLGRSPASFVPWRTTWGLDLRGYTAFPASVVGCT